MYTINKFVAVEPFTTTSTTIQMRHGVALPEQKHALTPLKVVYGNDDTVTPLNPGDIVFVLGESCKHEFAKRIFDAATGTPFILVPMSSIVMVEKRIESDCGLPNFNPRRD